MSYECRFFSNRFSVNVNFRVLLKGLNGSSKADFLSFCRSRHDTEESFAAQPLLLSFHGPLPTDFLGPRYIFPRIFPIPCLALIRSKITKLPAGTSGRLSAILPLCSVVFFKKFTTDDRSDDNVFKSLDQPLVSKSILQILQKSLGTMLVPFSGVFIPGLLCCKLHAWPRSTRSTRSNDILSLFTTQVGDGLLIPSISPSLPPLRFFSFRSSPLRDSLSPLCSSLSLSRTKFSRKTSGTRVSVCPFVFAGMVHDNFSNCSSILVPRLKVTKRRALEMRARRTCAYEQRRKLAPRQHVDPIFLRWNNLIHIIMYAFNSMRHLCDV